MIKFINGNIFDTTADVIAHCVNCKKVMGGGIALQIKRLYPIVFQKYCDLLEEYGSEDCLGKSQLIQLKDLAIANLFGQKDFGTDKQYVEYSALESSFHHLFRQMIKHNLSSVAFPDMIGCGLAGGDREIVLKMITKIFNIFDVEFWKYDNSR
jgi:O-acetyl-ADP-ribose deacetylase (regulator of RNase III)